MPVLMVLRRQKPLPQGWNEKPSSHTYPLYEKDSKDLPKYPAAHIMQNYMRRNNLVFSYFVINFADMT